MYHPSEVRPPRTRETQEKAESDSLPTASHPTRCAPSPYLGAPSYKPVQQEEAGTVPELQAVHSGLCRAAGPGGTPGKISISDFTNI